MIQSAMFFLLGALGTLLGTLLVVPALIRRAERLERRRLESVLPMTLEEMQAERDRLRASFAVEIRKVEMDAKAAREDAATIMIARDRGREEMRQLGLRLDNQMAATAELDRQNTVLREALARAEEQIEALQGEQAAQQAAGAARDEELRTLGRLREQAGNEIETQKAALAAREAEVERLASELAAQRSAVREADRRIAEMAGEILASREAATSEKRRHEESETLREEMRARLSDARESLDRRGRDAERARSAADAREAEIDRLNGLMTEARADRARLEMEVASLNSRIARLFPRSGGGDPEAMLAAATAERDRLEASLAALTRENKRLREARNEEGNTALREEMLQLAATVTAMAAQLEGPDGTIDRILAGAPSEEGAEDATPSLAERIRRLRAQASDAAEK